MRRRLCRSSSAVLLLAAVGSGIAAAAAATHPEVTVVPRGDAAFPAIDQKGKRASTTQASWPLPLDVASDTLQPLVLIAAQPVVEVKPATSQAATRPGELPIEEPPPEKKRVPATLDFVVGGKRLPTWVLTPEPAAYVINLQTLRTNPGFARGRFEMTVTVETPADGVVAHVVAMPDPLLVDDSHDGLWNELTKLSPDADVRAFMDALAVGMRGQEKEARAAVESLRSTTNENLARLVRRELRLASYRTRKHKLSGDFLEHYRWGVYLQACGFFEQARVEFEECRILDPSSLESQYRAGEMHDRMRHNQLKVMEYMRRAGDPRAMMINWDALVLILKSRTCQIQEKGSMVQKVRTLTSSEIDQIKTSWLLTEFMIWGATAGRVHVVTSFMEIDDDRARPFVQHDGGILAPADIVEERGWFDTVITVVPRCSNDTGPDVRAVGGDAGPNGAGLAMVYDDATWSEMMDAWYRLFHWAADVGEVGSGTWLPATPYDCGPRPLPHNGFACRTALHNDCTPAMQYQTHIAVPAAPETHVRLWTIEGPYAVNAGQPQPGQRPSRHASDAALVAGPAAKTIQIDSKTDFVDLAAVLPDAGWVLAKATCWVYSPKNQMIRFWLGQNDGAAVWVNGQRIHTGRYYSAHKYEDKNLIDTIAGSVLLSQGWNEVRVVVESWPAPLDKGWGFSLRFCEWNNSPVPGLAYLHTKPKDNLVAPYEPPAAGGYYAWSAVATNYQAMMPRLTDADLQKLTTVTGLTVKTLQAEKGEGCVWLGTPPAKASDAYRLLPPAWQLGADRDVRLNNVMDLAREEVAVFRYQKNGQDHDLMLLKPAAIAAYCGLLRESPRAAQVFGGRRPADRLLGYVCIPANPAPSTQPDDGSNQASCRPLLAVDVLLDAPGDWPHDEEDLLTPAPR